MSLPATAMQFCKILTISIIKAKAGVAEQISHAPVNGRLELKTQQTLFLTIPLTQALTLLKKNCQYYFLRSALANSFI